MRAGEGTVNFIAQRLPVDIARCRQSADYNVRARRNQPEQFERHRLEAASNEIALHSVTHILRDDKAETNRNTGGTRMNLSTHSYIKNGVRIDDPHTAPNDALIVTAARDAIYVSEHENLATTRN